MAENSPSTEYLFDFIYLDRARLASYCAQLFDDGTLTSVKSLSGINKKNGVNLKAELLGNGGEYSNEDELESSIEKTFDSFWTMPLNVLNRLSEFGYLQKDLSQTGLGKLALVHGQIQFSDIRMLRNVWSPILDFMNMTSDNKMNHKEKAAQSKIAKMMENLPHALQLNFISEDYSAWSTLNPDYMIINPEDLAFKHGSVIPGDWNIICIVDAEPAEVFQPPNLPGRDIDNAMFGMLHFLKTFLGRPDDSYGITPIAIFRAIKPHG